MSTIDQTFARRLAKLILGKAKTKKPKTKYSSLEEAEFLQNKPTGDFNLSGDGITNEELFKADMEIDIRKAYRNDLAALRKLDDALDGKSMMFNATRVGTVSYKYFNMTGSLDIVIIDHAFARYLQLGTNGSIPRYFNVFYINNHTLFPRGNIEFSEDIICMPLKAFSELFISSKNTDMMLTIIAHEIGHAITQRGPNSSLNDVSEIYTKHNNCSNHTSVDLYIKTSNDVKVTRRRKMLRDVFKLFKGGSNVCEYNADFISAQFMGIKNTIWTRFNLIFNTGLCTDKIPFSDFESIMRMYMLYSAYQNNELQREYGCSFNIQLCANKIPSLIFTNPRLTYNSNDF